MVIKCSFTTHVQTDKYPAFLQESLIELIKNSNPFNDFEELKFERDRLKKQRDVEKSINFSRKIQEACAV